MSSLSQRASVCLEPLGDVAASVSSGHQRTTASLALATGAEIAPHRHDEPQVVYASQGVVAVTTEGGSWVAPRNRAIWIPAGMAHHHRAYGATALHTFGLAGDNPLGLSSPTILAVSPLLRELVVAFTAHPAEDTPRRRRLRAVIVDELRATGQEP
ncbi:MAG: AraC family ligand binding domain-containing protein, partial [Dermatophilaceae bacterium]